MHMHICRAFCQRKQPWFSLSLSLTKKKKALYQTRISFADKQLLNLFKAQQFICR